MRTFGGFKSDSEFFYGEVVGENVHVLQRPFWRGIEPAQDVRPLHELRVDLPVAPSKLIAVGLNYADHIAEMKRTPLGTPLIWFKATTSLLPHEDPIEIAFPDHQTDFELELTIVIGRAGKNIEASEAANYIFGYTIGLDISDRDLQKKEKQFSRCKSFDTYTPIGPFVYSDVEVADLPLELRQNGQVRQRARTSQMIYPPAEIVAFASEQMTLLPGDVILTGTPSGVGPIRAGDKLEARIGDWPVLRNRVTDSDRTDEFGQSSKPFA
jgi:2-keto-4-pentenoate hydratase/2-oxohepta-3-ene-1,7-dioic acid hydratase in catechol pathway